MIFTTLACVACVVGPPLIQKARRQIEYRVNGRKVRLEAQASLRRARPRATDYRREKFLVADDYLHVLVGECLINGEWFTYRVKEGEKATVSSWPVSD